MAAVEHKLRVECPSGEVYELTGRPCELSAFSFVPTERHEPQERTYFNVPKEEKYKNSTYDRLFHQDFGYNNKLHRCDREHAKSKGLKVNEEEQEKKVPSLDSSTYGHILERQIDIPDRKNVRIARVRAEFYRRTGINDLQQSKLH